MPQFSEAEKLDAEVLKLRAEERNLSRPFLRQPASWLALGTLAISLGVNLMQHSDAEVKETKAKASEILARTEEIQHKLQSDKLKEEEAQLQVKIQSRQRSLDDQSEQLALLQAKVEEIQREIARASTTKESLGRAAADLQSTLQHASQSTKDTSQELAKPLASGADRNAARALDAKGYRLLVDGDLAGALQAFAAAEDAYNGYHFSYEIARLLRQRKASLDDPAVRKDIYRTVVMKYLGHATPEQQRSLKALAN